MSDQLPDGGPADRSDDSNTKHDDTIDSNTDSPVGNPAAPGNSPSQLPATPPAGKASVPSAQEQAATPPARTKAPTSPTRGKHAATRNRAWRALWFIPEPESERWWRSWFLRSLVLLTGVLVLTGLFIASYLGAFHNPTPRDVTIGVLQGDTAARQFLDELAEPEDTLRVIEYPDANAARSAILKRRVNAVLSFAAGSGAVLEAPGEPGNQPAPTAGAELIVATGGSPTAVNFLSDVLTTATTSANVPLTVTDVAPLSQDDPNGVSPYYLTIGWVLGGMLSAIVLAMSAGTVPRDFERAAMRLGALGAFSLLAGLLGALVAGPILNIWSGHFLGLTVVGTLIFFAAAVFTSALCGWLGMVGSGVAFLLFVILGFPGSGGLYAPEFLPDFYRGLHDWVVPGLGTDLTRAAVYFDANGPGRSVTGLVIYGVIGIIGLLAATVVLGRRGPQRQQG